MVTTILVLMCWGGVSFLLHNIIHEGAHALTAMALGSRVTRFWPFPSTRNGWFTWASVEYTPVQRLVPLVLVAPLVFEALWLILFSILSQKTTGLIQKLTFVEMVASNVDVVVWLLGYWNPKPNEKSDAEKFRAHLGFSRIVGKLLSLLHLPVLIGSGFLIGQGFLTS